MGKSKVNGVSKNPSVDLLKGALILLVMAGHAMELTHQHHLALWVGSGFRMPLMIGISGYLLNVAQTRTDPPGKIFRRYGERMLLPWTVAMLVYVLISGWRLEWALPIELLLRPPFHLWYIAILFFLIMLTRLVPLSPLLLLAIGAPVSLATMYGFGLDHGPIGDSLLSPDNRYLRYPVYFFFGMLMAERGLRARHAGVAMLVCLLGLLWWAELYSADNILALVSARLLMCLGLIALLPILSRWRIACAPLNAIGRDSLFFYLWHPLVMGVLVLGGWGPLATVALALLALALASRLTGRHRGIARLVGSIAPGRPAAPVQPQMAVTAAA